MGTNGSESGGWSAREVKAGRRTVEEPAGALPSSDPPGRPPPRPPDPHPDGRQARSRVPAPPAPRAAAERPAAAPRSGLVVAARARASPPPGAAPRPRGVEAPQQADEGRQRLLRRLRLPRRDRRPLHDRPDPDHVRLGAQGRRRPRPRPECRRPGRPRPRRAARRGLYDAVRFYRTRISPTRAACCPYTPSCSTYAVQALHRHGAVRGSRLTAGRLLRCRPGTHGGHDPVPGR
ncbi:membrane protein insertion efficiency factor YidD [Kitasatospora arboriphila]